MRKIRRAPAALALLSSFLTLGIFSAAPQAARADDVPIIVGKPIIKPDKHKTPKKDSDLAVAVVTVG